MAVAFPAIPRLKTGANDRLTDRGTDPIVSTMLQHGDVGYAIIKSSARPLHVEPDDYFANRPTSLPP